VTVFGSRSIPIGEDDITRGLSASIRIRAAGPADVELIFGMVVELAEYERAREHVVGTPELLADALFGPRPAAQALIAELDGVGVGFALYYQTFSTWECRPGIWLEDLYVSPHARGSGAGWALLSHLARITIERGFPRLEWAALDWNTPALDFYARAGASLLDEWRIHRLAGDALEHVARSDRP
jgi:GNAT superfamily N-acetyltransferase